MGNAERTWAALPVWLAVAPAFYLHWLPWWYAAPILAGAVVSESWAEQIGKRG